MKRTLPLIVLFCLLAPPSGCVIAPQPDPPDMSRIYLSSVAGAGEVAVFGRPGSVGPQYRVRVERTRGSEAVETLASFEGSFVATIWAEEGEQLSITCWDESIEEYASDAAVPTVDIYDPTVPGGSPTTPASSGVDPELAMSLDPPDERGRVRVWCVEGCLEPGVVVAVGNVATGIEREFVYEAGDFEMRVPADVGDTLIVFAVNPDDPMQSSEPIRLEVPAPPI